MAEQEKLFEKFQPVSTQEWLDKIKDDLKGADFNKKMIWKTNEGFDVKPFYRDEDIHGIRAIDSLPGEFPYLRGTKKTDNSWYVRQNITVTDYPDANRKVLDILKKGVNSIGFIIADPESVNKENFDSLLKDINFEGIETNFLCNGKALEILSLFGENLNKKGINPDNVYGALEVHPLGRLMLNGTLCIDIEEGLDYLAKLVKQASCLKNFRVVQVDAFHFNNSGADIVTELAFGLAMGNDYMARLTDRGIDSAYAATKIRFSFGIGSNYFMEIAKLRAARLLWSVIAGAYNPSDKESIKINIHCVTSEWNKTVYDPYINLLRTQTEAMSAILGGTDSLTVEPFDIVYKSPDEFSERIARNQQLLLKDEVHFDKIVDPASGSYYIENLTSLITEKAWGLFIEVEEKGGFLQALKEGFIQKKIKEISYKRKKDVTLRKESFVGTNQYPDLTEIISEKVDAGKMFQSPVNSSNLVVEPIIPSRATEEIEKLRLAVDNAKKRPTVFLFTTGNPAMKKARAQFSSSFFGCAGYSIIENSDFATFDDGVKAAIDSKAEIVVICSSDEEYAEVAPLIFNKLKDSSIIVVAGAPPDMENLKSKGLEHFISIRSDLHETLQMLNSKLGIHF
jgi:methylmalonyl-CoA mutase